MTKRGILAVPGAVGLPEPAVWQAASDRHAAVHREKADELLLSRGTDRRRASVGSVPGLARTVPSRREKGAPARMVVTVLVFAASLLASLSPAAAQSIEDEIRLVVKAGAHPYGVASSRAAWVDLRRTYELSGASPLWIQDGQASALADELLETLTAAGGEGLRPEDYAASGLADRAARLATTGASARDVAWFDTAMTLSLLRFVSDLHRGRVDPTALGFRSLEKRTGIDRPTFVDALARADDPTALLRSLDPPFPVYGRLRVALRRMSELALQEPVELPERIPVLHPGDSGPEVPRLRKLLRTLGDFSAADTSALDSEQYDPYTAEAVRSFQHRHGLQEDGVVGPATLRQMRVPLSQRVRQIELAMERLRWLAEPNGERFLIVNIPAFRLLAFEKGRARPRLMMDVVVGKAARLNRTPLMQAEMTSVIFRPYWNVPPSIARREIFPQIERDPSYLERKRMEIVGGRVRQRPGANNSLGLVKFQIPNPYNVYLHDTPSRSLFSRARRDFSHGCIRLAKPAELAELVLENRAGWNLERIMEAMQRGKNNTSVPVEPPIPVYVLYSTAIVDPDDRVHFFDDIYGHDDTLRRMLDARARGG